MATKKPAAKMRGLDTAVSAIDSVAVVPVVVPDVPAVIKTVEEQSAAVQLAQTLKAGLKTIEDDRDQVIKPIRKALDNLYARYRIAKAPYEKALTTIKEALADFEMRARAAEAKRIQKTARYKQAGEEVRGDMLARAEDVKAAPIEGGAVVNALDVIVIDDRAVPVSFQGVTIRPIDEPALRRAAKLAHAEVVEIPGVKIEKTVKVRL